MSQNSKEEQWYTPSERMPTFDDGPRRFTNKVEVEVECQDGIERRNCFVGGGFDDDEWLKKRVIRWRRVSTGAPVENGLSLSDEKLDQLDALEKAASAGPWIPGKFGRIQAGPEKQYVNGASRDQIASFMPADWMPQGQQDVNAAFVAAAREAVPALIVAVRKAAKNEQELVDAARNLAAELAVEKALNVRLTRERDEARAMLGSSN